MTKIEEIWYKNSDLTTEQMFWWQFEQAADELIEITKEACAKVFLTEYNNNYDDPITFMNKTKDKILNAKLEGE